MIFKQVFDKKSSTYTYIIASSEGREALIIDPVLENVGDYIKLLDELNLKLVKVIDTHIHADHVTGASKLRDKTQCVTINSSFSSNTLCAAIFLSDDRLLVFLSNFVDI